jgi:adenine-specific DNA methylase
MQLDASILPPMVEEPSIKDLEDLPPKLQEHQVFFERLLTEVKPTQLPPSHNQFLRTLGILGDADRAWRRLALAEGANNGKDIILGSIWGYRHERAFALSPSSNLLTALHLSIREVLQFTSDDPVIVLDSMAGGGVIPLEATRYGLKVYANDLNPVAVLVLKATIEYPAQWGRDLGPKIETYARQIHEAVHKRLSRFFPFQLPAEWWSEEKTKAARQFRARAIVSRQPAEEQDPIKNTYLWLRIVPCSKCELNIPISTNFLIVSKKGKPEASIAAFPVVPRYGQSNDCTFRVVPRAEWKNCIWPHPGFEHWDPRNTPTFKDGRALCPRCGQVVDGDDVKRIARSREGGLPAQMYAVCSQVPVKLTYRNGEVKVRYLWRFRAPTQADLDAVGAAEEELARLRPRWEVQDLIPTKEVPEDMEDKRPREYGMPRWRDLFREPLAESNREAVANAARWQWEADAELAAWQTRYDEAVEALRAQGVKVREAKTRALAMVGPKPLSAKERADRFYEDKMAAVFRRTKQLLHPAGRMVVMFNHKATWAWRSLGMALIRAGFEIRSSVPIHTEAESTQLKCWTVSWPISPYSMTLTRMSALEALSGTSFTKRNRCTSPAARSCRSS